MATHENAFPTREQAELRLRRSAQQPQQQQAALGFLPSPGTFCTCFAYPRAAPGPPRTLPHLYLPRRYACGHSLGSMRREWGGKQSTCVAEVVGTAAAHAAATAISSKICSAARCTAISQALLHFERATVAWPPRWPPCTAPHPPGGLRGRRRLRGPPCSIGAPREPPDRAPRPAPIPLASPPLPPPPPCNPPTSARRVLRACHARSR